MTPSSDYRLQIAAKMAPSTVAIGRHVMNGTGTQFSLIIIRTTFV